MSEIRLNDEAIGQFERELGGRVGEAESLVQGMENDLRRLGDVWTDKQFDDFRETFEQTLFRLKAFIEDAEAFRPRLSAAQSAVDEAMARIRHLRR